MLTGEEEAVDDLREAHAGEVGGDGDGGGRRAQRRGELRQEAHPHLARGVGGAPESMAAAASAGGEEAEEAAAAGREGGVLRGFRMGNLFG